MRRTRRRVISTAPQKNVEVESGSYVVDLQGQWRLSTTIANPDSSLYDGVYESFSNKGVNYGTSIMRIYINGLTEFKFYVRSYAESSYDYVVVSNLDCNLSSGTTSGTNVKLTTSSKQNSGTTIESYQLVEFTNIDGGEHFITVMYRKDSGVNNGTDQGYVLIPKITNVEPVPEAHSYLTVTYQPMETSADTVFYSSKFDATQLVSMEIDGVYEATMPTSRRYSDTATTHTVRYGFHENLTNCAYLFDNVRSITNIDASEWDTSKVTDMSYMFAWNKTSIDTQNLSISSDLWDVSKVTNMSHMFQNRNLTRSNWTTWANQVTAVTNTSYMFDFALRNSSTDYTFGAWNLSSIEDMSYMFQLFSCNSNDLKTWNVSNVKNLEGLFKGTASCQTKSLDLSGWNVSNATNMSYMFYGLKYLETITGLETWNTSAVTDMSYMFSDNKALKTFNVSNWNTQNVKNMAYMFQGLVSATTSVDLTNWDVRNVEDMNHMFANSTKLTSIGDISNWNVSNVKNLSFFVPSHLTPGLDISKWRPSNVENIEYLFKSAKYTDLSFVINDWDLSKVTKMAGLFYGCSALTSVGDFATLFASKYDTTKLETIDYLFYGCSNLTSIGNFSAWSMPLVENYSYMFGSCSGLTSIGSVQNFPLRSDGTYTPIKNITYMFHNCKNLDDVGNIGNWDGSQNTNAAYAFANCNNFSNLGQFNNWHTSGKLTSIEAMFMNCPAAHGRKIGDLSNWNTSAVTNMSYFIANNISLMNEQGHCYGEDGVIDIGDINNWDTRNVTKMEYMLAGNSNFNQDQTITSLSNWNTSAVTSMKGLFCGDSLQLMYGDKDSDGLPALFSSLSGWNVSKVTNMSYMFYGVFYGSEATNISYFDALKNWDVSKVTDISYMFKGCQGMNFTQPFYYWKDKMSGVTTMQGLFLNMSEVEENTSQIDIKLTEFKNKTTNLSLLFEDRQSLTGATVMLGKGTTADTKVTTMNNMFSGCKSLTSIKMKVPISTATTITNMYSGVPSSGTFYYPSGKLSDYQRIIPDGWTAKAY